MIQYTKKKRVGKGRFLRISGSRFLLMRQQREEQVDRKRPQKKKRAEALFSFSETDRQFISGWHNSTGNRI